MPARVCGALKLMRSSRRRRDDVAARGARSRNGCGASGVTRTSIVFKKMDCRVMRARPLPCPLVEKIVDLLRRLRTHARHLFEIGGGGALDRLERSEMLEQRALAGRADAGDFLQ